MYKNNSNVCNNCGKQGHIYNNCKMPIISYGIISIRKKKEFEYLIMCRKDSLGYVDFLRGKYPIYNKEYIQNLIDEMTVAEKKKILTTEFSELWSNLWGNTTMLQYRTEEKTSSNKFYQIKRGIQLDDVNSYNLKCLIDKSDTNWETPEWGFPKGRRNYGEKDIQASTREWLEETGISEEYLNIISNIVPYEESFIGSNFKSYKHKYYLAVIKNDVSIDNYQKTEVSKLKWATLEESINYIRPYNLERINIIKKIDKIHQDYSLI
jgi:8-oxo-dGTP pyrophosphatase MutT (NUDIX family)